MGIQIEDPFPARLLLITIQPSALGGLVHLLGARRCRISCHPRAFSI